MEIIFLAQEMIISKTYEIIFVALLEMISGKLEMGNGLYRMLKLL